MKIIVKGQIMMKMMFALLIYNMENIKFNGMKMPAKQNVLERYASTVDC